MRQPDRLATAQWTDPTDAERRLPFRPGTFWLGRIPPSQAPAGIDDDRHVCLVAGTRAGKATSIIVPNLLLWRGSVVVVDPTGDLATLTAAHRGAGAGGKTGLGQKVHVLDPYCAARIDDGCRARFNPLDGLDVSSRRIERDVEVLVGALVPPAENDDNAWLANGARRLLTALVLHVLTAPQFDGRRNLVTVRHLLQRGDTFLGVTLDPADKISPFDLLWSGMERNDAFAGHVQGAASEFREMSLRAGRQWVAVKSAAGDATNFINNEDMRDCLSASTFSLRDLKADPAGATLYLTIPSRNKDEDFRWLRMMVSLVLAEAEANPQPPACGSPMLLVLDEFASLKRMERIESGIAEMAKYGVKMMLVLQSLPQLKKEYGDNWETFLANCGTKLFFGIDDQFTREQVSKLVGDTEVVKEVRSSADSTVTGESRVHTTGQTIHDQTSVGRVTTDSYKRAPMGLRDTMGFFRKMSGNVQASDAEQSSTMKGKAQETSEGLGTNRSTEKSTGVTESLHVRPLVTPDEVGRLFRRIEPADSALYPGMMIAVLSSLEHPVMVRRTNHFDDSFFEDPLRPATAQAPAGAASEPAASEYRAGEIELPFESQALTVLGDGHTAIVAGVGGEIAAVDLRSGAVLDTANSEPTAGRLRPGGGEIRYIGGRFCLLARSPTAQGFLTLGHSGVLGLWNFDGKLKQQAQADLLGPHRTLLRSRIAKAQQGKGWSVWTVYNREPPEAVPEGIVAAKLAPDRSSIVCLTDWFAIFRCDLAGRLLQGPFVVGDVFAIEPASPDGSVVWIGREALAGMMRPFKLLMKLDLRTGASEVASPNGLGADFGSRGIHALSASHLLAGGLALSLPELAPMASAQLTAYGSTSPLPLPDLGLVADIQASLITLHQMQTLSRQGMPLLAGHAGELRAVDRVPGQSVLVSLAARSLRVWDLAGRCPVGGYPPAREFLGHGLHNRIDPAIALANGAVLYRGSDGRAALIDGRERTHEAVRCPEDRLVGATALDGAVHVLSLDRRPGETPKGVKGLLGRLLDVKPRDVHLIRHRVVGAGRTGEVAVVPLQGARLDWCEPLADNTRAVDIGDGRLAILTAGHVAVYDVRARRVVCGPVDVSGPVGEVKMQEASWTYYSQITASADRTKLILRGRFRAIKVLQSLNLATLHEIDGTASDPGLLLSWVDGRHFLYSVEIKGADCHDRRELRLADSETGAVLGPVCELERYVPPSNSNYAVLLPHGSVLAIIEQNEIRLIDLVSGIYLPEPLGAHSDSIDSIHICPNGEALMSTSQDGTARFWELGGVTQDSIERRNALLARVRSGRA